MTWNVLVTLDYRFSQHFSGKLGYRIFSMDYERGSGPNEFGFNAKLSGPMLGLTFRF